MKRIQRKNFFEYNWKSNPNAVYVGRPSKWGNPYKLKDGFTLEESLIQYKSWLELQLDINPHFLDALIGKDLVCFCPLNQPCHADIIMGKLEEKAMKND